MQNKHDNAIIIALGSNLPGPYGSPVANLEHALHSLSENGFTNIVRSSWWHSRSWPNIDYPSYINAVALVETTSDPISCLKSLQKIEARFGRHRSLPNRPRSLDLDLIAYRRTCLEETTLTLPHLRCTERFFVMGPLAEVAPDWVHPGLGKTALELAKTAPIGRDSYPIADPAL